MAHTSTPFWTRMRPLGNLRCRILACLGADDPKLPAFFDPPPDMPAGEALHRHLLELHDAFGADPDSLRIVAAGLLSFGELDRAGEILSRFPREPITLDHGAGWCGLIAYSAVAELLPLPAELGDVRRWTQESDAAGDVVQWLASNHNRLAWDAAGERFVWRREA